MSNDDTERYVYGTYRARASRCLERNPHFHKRSMERGCRCELCGVSNR